MSGTYSYHINWLTRRGRGGEKGKRERERERERGEDKR